MRLIDGEYHVYVYICVHMYMNIDLLPALRSSVARIFSGAAQRSSNRGFMRLVDGKYHVYVYIHVHINRLQDRS